MRRRKMESAVGKELKVIDTQSIRAADWGGHEPPEFKYRGDDCPVEMPQAMYDQFSITRKQSMKLYAFVLREKVVKAVEIASMSDLSLLDGPYLGFHVIHLIDKKAEAAGMGTAGEGDWGWTQLFIPLSSDADRIQIGLDYPAIEGTKEYDNYINECGLVRIEDRPEDTFGCYDCGGIVDASQSVFITKSGRLCERCA
jgi:hypothetical protein